MMEKFTLTKVIDANRKIKYSFFQGENDECPIRLEEEMDSLDRVSEQRQMTADRIIVELDKNVYATPKAFRQDLEKKLSDQELNIQFKMLRSVDSNTKYLLQFDYSPQQPEFYTLIRSAAKKMTISATPHALQITPIQVIDTVEKKFVSEEEHSDNRDLMKDSLYLQGCQARDSYPNDFAAAIKLFKDSHSFEGTYAIAELYYFGASYPFFEKDLPKAAAFYLDAYEYHRDKFTVEVDNMPPILSSSLLTLIESNELLCQAHELNPDALYHLAQFYRNEEKALNDNRIISASAQELSERISGCLKASADLYHPHAAFILATEYGKQLSIEKKLKYSRIAADPETARTTELTSFTTYSFRGAQPVKTELKLLQGLGLPIVLCKQLNVGSNANLKNLYQQNEHVLVRLS